MEGNYEGEKQTWAVLGSLAMMWCIITLFNELGVFTLGCFIGAAVFMAAIIRVYTWGQAEETDMEKALRKHYEQKGREAALHEYQERIKRGEIKDPL